MSQLIKQIKDIWGFKELNIISKITANGHRTVDVIETEKGKYVLKAFPSALSESSIKKYTEALNYISRKEIKLSPVIIQNKEKSLYTRLDNRYVYIMEYIEGRPLKGLPEDEYKLGQASAILHSFNDYNQPSCLVIKERISNMKERFSEYPFKKEYDEIVIKLPDFDKYKQAFIHTDIGPHNAVMRKDGSVIFVDFDDAGMGSPFIDIGYPLITQFVQINKETKEIKFNYENALAFYLGYYSKANLTMQEKNLIFDGAVFMQLMYMPCFGKEAVQDMWDILKFGIDNKDLLLSSVHGLERTH